MNDPILVADRLARFERTRDAWYKKSTQKTILDHLSFTVEKNKTLAILGESGSGKSTLARYLVGAIEPHSGHLFIDGQNATVADSTHKKELFRKISMIFQNPYASLNPQVRIGSQLEQPLLFNTKLSTDDRQQQIAAILQKVGLRADHAELYPNMFSGGQRQRIAIARALMLEPWIIVADEPLSALDVSVQAQIINLLLELQEEFNLAYVFISHDFGVIKHISDEVFVLYLGRMMEYGPTDQVLEQPRHPYTRALLASAPSVNSQSVHYRPALTLEAPPLGRIPKGCAFHTRCPYATELCRQEVPIPRSYDDHMVACHHVESIA